ncbi:type I site-specific deoxyribonuclease, HsdR family [Lachnoanaerobaculum saburreum F0468]|uniref:Type I restriction enzyme endonuclease subunit n=1 Tax=Lachnoanaerobaculum saburreum F0468 TaxID=1095750 RepID=I0R579_9FIRM|nr:type I site-specific deoxyribonuclease, HsdR family [Lachnoanaerobaculum saburreum F0468]
MLQNYGWERNVLKNCTEKDLIRNWADILFENNRDIDRLNNIPLIDEEMYELIEKIRELKTPLALNSFINGKTVSITRKNPEDKLHFNKEVSLKVYDRNEIAAGQSRYQIVQQPKFFRKDSVRQGRRGDLMLLINGMPFFHIELKRSGVSVADAANQIKKYAYEGVFTGLFALIQVFVAMNPDETLYFANPGSDGAFKPAFYFHWADANNNPMNCWKDVVERLLSIPMAHQLIGFYTVADGGDGVLKVMRSYQYYASNKISDRVSRNDWKDNNQRGGYIWHTTGSGKTMTSFKSAQLIANSKDADKVVFLMDRKELGSQSLTEYQGFADNEDDVQGTDDTNMLISKLKSTDPKNTLIVSSIQKMSRIKEDEIGRMRAKDIEDMRNKRVVFIIDECHRSTFGDMLITIKNTFPNALFFGFTGTPVFCENEKKLSTTTDIFGDELHRYSIADGIRDKNVLGFDPTMVCVYPDIELRKKVAIEQAGASSEKEAISDPKMQKIYYRFMTASEVLMAGRLLENGTYQKGIEDYIKKDAWENNKYQYSIVDNIKKNWLTLSRNNKFHAIFATSSIPEAISYYRKFREIYPDLKVTGLFDPTIDNVTGDKALEKEDGIVEMLNDYNNWYSTNWDIARYAKFKLEVSERLAHKGQFVRMKEESQLDLLIVVNQMLTGFDSKWVNTLYLDKILEYQNLIQAFSRTNRLFNINEKPFGSIKYYRMPHTMKNNIENAMKLYSGDRPQGLFADHLPDNIEHMNATFRDIAAVFKQANIANMQKLPDDTESKAKFAKLFREFSTYLQAAKIQGFSWDIKEYSIKIDDEDNRTGIITVVPSEEDYNILLQRYKELSKPTDSTDGDDNEITFTVDPYLSEQNTGIIDNDYMNSRFEKWQKQLYDPNVSKEEREATLEELHKSFAMLSQEEQKYANIFLHDIQSGDAKLGKDMTFRDYIVMYAKNKEMSQIKKFVKYLGVEESLLVDIKKSKVTESNLDEFGRYDALKKSIANEPATEYYTKLEGKKLPPFVVRNNAEKLLRDYILYDIDIKDPDGED